MSKKPILIIFFVIIFSVNIFSFNYDSYKVFKLNNFVVKTYTELPGMSFINTFVGFPIKLKNYPDTSNDENYSFAIEYFEKTLGAPKNVFGYVQIINVDKYKIILVYQNQLVDYIKQDVKINEDIGLYCLLGYCNGNEIVCMVSAFNTIIDYKRRNVKPIWQN